MVLESIDLGKRLERKPYEEEKLHWQLEMRRLAWQLYAQKRSAVVVLEGWDAAGKGGAIRRLTEKLDPRGYHVYSIAAPQGDDKERHYLWRFWRRLIPADEKQLVIFDRSWYGRVLVERVEGFASEPEWKRAFREINEFEQQLVDARFVLVKLWLHLSRKEQARRFEDRKKTAYKAWKLTDEDWRNREKWGLYERAADDMLVKTSTRQAPWTIVEAEDKWFARVKVLRTVAEALGQQLDPVAADETGAGAAR
jgi:polyphosphate kinase 2 (PPK2 family)